MFRLLTIAAVTILFLLPIQAIAGGPPLLCLPIDGATAENADVCAKRIAAALGNEVERAAMRQNDGQWYLTFHFNRERVRLSEIDAALKGSPFSVPRDKLRLFGDVILEVDLRDASADKLLADLRALRFVTASESKREGDKLLVTLTLPAPSREDRPADFGNVSFKAVTFHSEDPSIAAATASDLPSYAAVRGVIEKHKASLTGIRWNCWGCRALGCIAGAKQERVSSAAVLPK